jgi:hypothetical protein
MIGYDELVKAIELRYPDYVKDWWRMVAFPPFAQNYTLIWGETHPDNDPPINAQSRSR